MGSHHRIRHARPATAQVVHPHVQSRHGARQRMLGDARGVLVVPDRVRGAVISQAEMAAAVAALRRLPAADLALIASRGIAVHLVPTSGLEDGLLGATTILQAKDGSWYPTEIRIAAHAGLSGEESLGEIVQHEFGHAVAVLRQQDRSEEAAIAYARQH